MELVENVWCDGKKYICEGQAFPEWVVRGLEVGSMTCRMKCCRIGIT